MLFSPNQHNLQSYKRLTFVWEKIPKDFSTLCDKVLEWTGNFPGVSAADRNLHLA